MHDVAGCTLGIVPHLLAALVAPAVRSAVLVDVPTPKSYGRDGIGAAPDAVQAQFPGHTFRRTTAVDEHHGVARYGWALLSPDGTPVLTALDVADLTEDGRLRRVVGFCGDQEPVA